jgi:rod shape-determining protein MreD
MTDLILKNIIRFIFLALLQVLILDNIRFSGYINPYLYVLFILLLPFYLPDWLLIILAFLLGFTIDMFTNTAGLHSAATVMLAFLRPFIIRKSYKKQEYDAPVSRPSIQLLGFRWFTIYSLILITIHHIVLFYLEAFNLSDFFPTLFRAGISVIATMILVILSEYMFVRKK